MNSTQSETICCEGTSKACMTEGLCYEYASGRYADKRKHLEVCPRVQCQNAYGKLFKDHDSLVVIVAAAVQFVYAHNTLVSDDDYSDAWLGLEKAVQEYRGTVS